MKSSPDNGLWVMWTLLFSWLLGLQCFFPVRFSLLKFKENLCCSWFFSHSVSSFPLHALTSFIKHSGIPCGIKIADGHSGSDRQDLPLEDSNSNCFSPLVSETPREKRFGRTKMLLKITHTSDRMPLLSALPYTTNHAGICGCNLPVASKALGMAPVPASCPREKGEEGPRRFHARPRQRCSEPPEAAAPTGAPAWAGTKAGW